MNTNVLHLLSRLKQLDITIELENDNLKIHAPEGKLVPALISEIKDKKKEIVAFMQQAQKQVKYTPVMPVEKKEYYIPSSAQRRLYILQQMEPGNTSYNMPEVLLLEEEIDKEQLENTFKKLITRHESLRTSFAMPGETPIQKVCPADELEFKIEYYDMKGVEVDEGGASMEGTRGLAPLPGEPTAALISSFIRPFDLSRAPLLRAGLITGESSHRLLLIDMHHIVTDGVSQELLKKEFTLLHTGNPLLPLKVYYKDYSEWQNSPAVKKVLQQQGESWLKEFSTDIPILNLPTDFARPLAQSYAGSSIKFELNPGESGALFEMARSTNTTIFILLMAIYYVFLSKLSGQEDIVVGTPTAGRRHPDLQQIIGIFINTLALRGCPAGNKSFTAFLGEVKEKILTALENQDYPFEDLVEEAAVERDMSRNPLFDVMFALEGALTHPGHTPDSPGEHSPIKPYDYENKTAKFDLTLYALETRDQLVFTFEYCTRLFKPETITIFIEYLQKIISEVIQNPRQQISGIRIISRQEREKILYGFNDTNAEFPGEKTIRQLFAEQAVRTPDHTALVGVEGTRGLAPLRLEETGEETGRFPPLPIPISITYRELNDKSSQLAHLLIEKGVLPDTIVGIMAERSIEMMVGIFGIVKAGSAYLPIDPDYPGERIQYILNDANVKILVKKSNKNSEFTPSDLPGWEGETILLAPGYYPGKGEVSLCQVSPTNLVYVIYTSGTTGKPKGVTIAHFSLVNRLNWMQKKYPVDKTDTILHKTPFTFDVSVWEIFWWAITGARVCLLVPGGEKEPEAIIDAIERNKVTTMHFVPSMLSVFLDYLKETGKSKQLSSLKQVIASGEALAISQVKRFHNLLYQENNTRLANLYGPTEAAIDVSYYDCFEKEEPQVIPIGKPIDNIRLYILDKYLHIQPTAIAGELYIAGVGLARGYLNRPSLTAEKFVEHRLHRSYKSYRPYIYRTGDLARWQPDGNIEFLGRIDHQVKIRGFRIELGEIESQLLRYSQVKEAVVMDRQTSGGGDDREKYLCAYIVSENDLASFLPGLQEFLAGTLPYYMIPAYFVRVERIPLTPNGKVNRNALPEPETKAGEDYTAPRHEIEEKLGRIWQNVLAIEKVGIKDNFFNIGGDSIRAIRVLSAVNTALNTQLRAVDLAANATIEKLAERIKQYKTGVLHTQRQEVLTGIEELKTRILAENKLKGDIEDIYPMSDIEKGMVFYSLKNPGEAVYHDQFPYILSFHTFEPDVFREAMNLMVEKHHILRTGFDMDSFEEPVQIVYKSVEPDIRHEDISDIPPHRQREYLTGYMVKDRENLFNVYSPPLWRMRTFWLGNKKICALWIFHHAIMDGWSVASLMTELNNTYLALKENPQYQVEKLKTDYKEFIGEQLIEKRKVENYTFWRNELENYKRLSFPILLENEKGAKVIKKYANEIGLTVLEALKQVAKKNDTSIKHLCFAAYIYMLSMFSLHNDIAAGMVTDNRPIAEDGEKVVGCFLNTIPVRVVIPALITWADYIRLVDKKMTEIARYNRLSLYEIVRIIGEKTRQDNPIFDTLLNYTDFHVYGLAAREKITDEEAAQGGFAVEVYENTNTLLDFTVNTLYPDFSVYISYTDSLIRENGVEKLCIYFKRVLDKFINEPHGLARKVDILPPEDKQQLLYDFNDTKAAYSRDKTLQQLFEEQVEKAPDNTAVIFNGNWINYRELNRRTNQLAWELRKKGVLPDRFVGVVMDRTNEMVIGVMAILKAGGAYVPIEPHLPEARIITCLATVNTKCLLTNRLQLKHTAEICQKLPGIKHIFCLDMDEITAAEPDAVPAGLLKGKTLILNRDTGKNPGENPPPAAQPGDIAYVIFTSGTTGLPKGVVEQHRPVVNIIQWVNKTSDVNGSDKLLFVASLGFDLSVYDIFGILAVGGAVRVVSREDIKAPERLLDIIFEEGITIWDSAPAALQQLVPYIEELKDTRHYPQKSKFRLVLLSGDWIPLTMPAVLKEAFAGIRIVAMGGGTEATIWSNFYIVGEVSPYWRSIPYGKPTQNARYYILDQFLNPCTVGVPGDLYIGGECLAAGYINDPVLTAHKFVPNPYETREIIYRTGDQARWYADGNMEFLGRQDNQVKIRGFRIELGEIESQLLKHKDIKEAVVLARAGKTKAKGDQYLCAYYVSDQTLTTAQLTRHLSEALPEYMIPPYFVRLEQMPVTANGKLDRKALPEPASGAGDDEFIAPRDELQKKLAAIWSEVLGIQVDKIGIDSNFFELGGHSLNATVMVPRIHKELNVRLPLSEIFITPTLLGQAEYIKNTQEALFTSILPVEKKEYYPLSAAQKRMFLLNRLKGDETSDNTPFVIQVQGKLQQNRLKEMIDRLIRRHESLRTSFELLEDTPIQRIHDHAQLEIARADLSNTPGDHSLEVDYIIQDFIRPFNLEKAPLFRAGLVKLPGETHVLMFDMHHIINDDISREIFIKESLNIYEGVELTPLKVQYKDFASWQNIQLQSGAIKQQDDFWLEMFSGEIPPLNLPTDNPRPEVQSFVGESMEFMFPREITQKIKKIMEEYDVTLFMVLLAVYNILLSKYSGQQDIIVGSPAAGRPHTDLENLIGMFANTLALRNHPTGEKTFIEFLEEVRTNSFRAFENQDYQFEDLVNKLGIKPDPSRNPLFDTMFTVVLEANVYGEGSVREVKDLVFKPYGFAEKVTQFDIIIHASDLGEFISLYLRYSTVLFKKETIGNLLGHFQEIAGIIGNHPHIKLAEVRVSHQFSDAASSIVEQAGSDFAF
ncbi:amino acid adenylation domain-containing protein [Acidobacteriota bacterium]